LDQRRFTKFGWLSSGFACYHSAKLVSAGWVTTMNKQKYCRWLLKQCETPTRSCVTVAVWGIVCTILGLASLFLVYQPIVHSRWDYLVADLFGGGALFGMGGICIKQAFHRRLSLEVLDRQKLENMITQSASSSNSESASQPPQG
jgi:hypothetical protein